MHNGNPGGRRWPPEQPEPQAQRLGNPMPAAFAGSTRLAAEHIGDLPAATESQLQSPGATFRAKTLQRAEQGELLGRNPRCPSLTQSGGGGQHAGEQLGWRWRQSRHDSQEMARPQGQQQALRTQKLNVVDQVHLRDRCWSDRFQPPLETHQTP